MDIISGDATARRIATLRAAHEQVVASFRRNRRHSADDKRNTRAGREHVYQPQGVHELEGVEDQGPGTRLGILSSALARGGPVPRMRNQDDEGCERVGISGLLELPRVGVLHRNYNGNNLPSCELFSQNANDVSRAHAYFGLPVNPTVAADSQVRATVQRPRAVCSNARTRH